MARGEYLCGEEVNGFPAGAELPEPYQRPFAVGVIFCTCGNQMCNSLAVPGDGNGLSLFHCLQKFRQPCLGFSGSNLTHTLFQPVVLTILFYWDLYELM